MCNREISSIHGDWFFPRSSTTIRGRSPGGSYQPTPLHWRRWRNTENGRGLIDRIFTNFLGPATSGVIIDTMMSDHFPIILSSNLGFRPNKVPKVWNRRFTPDQTESFRNRLFTLFENFYHIDCANTALNLFCETIESEIDNFFPFCQKSRKVTPIRPWLDSRLLERINTKHYLYKKYMKNKSKSKYGKFKSLRNHLKGDIRASKRNYYQKLLEENKNNAERS